VTVRVPNAPGGQHGSLTIRFQTLTGGVKVKNNSATIAYYVPTWWEANWKWAVPSIIVALILLYVIIALSWEYLTKNIDARRRAVS
jgi:hypothetical protein